MAENTKERIINAAFSLYRDGKIKKISLSQIAAKVGISKAAIFRHFENRQALEDALLQAVYDLFAEFVTVIQRRMKAGQEEGIVPFIIETLCNHTEYLNYLRSSSLDFTLDTFVLEGKKRGVSMFNSVFDNNGALQNKNFYYTSVFSCIEILEFVHIWSCFRKEDCVLSDFASQAANFIHKGLGKTEVPLSKERMDSLETTCLACVLNAKGVDSKLVAVSSAVAKKGYAELTMDLIAAELGMAKSSFYSTYKNKEDMIVSLLSAEMTEFSRVLFEALKEALSFDECIFCIVCTTLIYFFKRQEILEACKWIEFQMVGDENFDMRMKEVFGALENSPVENFVFEKEGAPEFDTSHGEELKTMARDLILGTAFGEPVMFLVHGIKHGFTLASYSEIIRVIYKMLMSGVVSYTHESDIWHL